MFKCKHSCINRGYIYIYIYEIVDISVKEYLVQNMKN